MVNFKQLIVEKKNVILAIIAITLILFTAYQLKLVGIATSDDTVISETVETATVESQEAMQTVEVAEVVSQQNQPTEIIEETIITQQNVVTEETEIKQDVVENVVNTIIEETVSENVIVNESVNTVSEVISNTAENKVVENIVNEVENTVTENIVNNSKNTVLENTANIVENTITNTITNTLTNTVIESTVLNETNTISENTITNEVIEETVEEIVNIPSELTFENTEYKVTVSAIKEDALKNIEKVNVTPITVETNAAEYNNISMKLQNQVEEENSLKTEVEQTELLGFLAYDITLINKDGLEVEPDGNVNVAFEYFTIPEKAVEYADADVSLVHFEENKLSGEVSLKEFSQEEQLLNVETNESNQVTKLEFETASFSTFTIKWTTYNRTAQIIVHYVDTAGNELQGTRTTDVNANATTYKLSTYAGEITNYTYQEARLGSISGNVVTQVTFSQSNYQSTVSFDDGTSENIGWNSTATYNVYLIYQTDDAGTATSTIPVGSTTTLRIGNVSNINVTDLVGFLWISNDTSVATVTVDGATGIPTVKGVKAGKTTIIGTRTVGDVTEKIIWTVTVENKVTSQIIFEHQEQDNESFANQDSYRPYSEYGYGSTEATNVIKFIVVLADENGKLTMYGSNPDVTLPEGSIVPDSYVFDLGEDKTLTITENTFEGISVPGYSYSGAFAYFGWSSNSDTADMAVVSTFRNFGKVSTGFPHYYSAIGFTTSRGTGGDYSSSTFGSAGAGYYAYNPTGVLMLVLSPVSDSVAYRTYYHNDYNPGGTAQTNIVDTTLANMVKGDWIADEYRYDYYGETIMTKIDSSTLVGPVGYEFVGWYDSVDEEGNGTGNLVSTSEDFKVGTSYYALVNGEKIIIRQNNNLYARWIPVTANLTIQKTISGGIRSLDIAELKNKIQFVVKNDSNEIVATILPTDIVWTGEVGTYTIEGLKVNTPYTVEELNQTVTGYEVETTITYPDGASYVQLSSETSNTTVYVENEYTTSILINKIDPLGVLKFGASFEIKEADGTNSRIVLDADDGNNDGKININYIKYDTEYIISEFTAPNGFYTLETPIRIKVSKVDGEDKITILNESELSGYVSFKNGALNVVNVQHLLMPKAGGCGTYLFYILGAFIMGSTVLIYKRNLTRKDEN